MVSSTPRPYFTPGKDTVPIVQEAGCAPGQVWTGAENLGPTGIFFLGLFFYSPSYNGTTVVTYILPHTMIQHCHFFHPHVMTQ